jgi:hypothetical protein
MGLFQVRPESLRDKKMQGRPDFPPPQNQARAGVIMIYSLLAQMPTLNDNFASP